MPLRNEIDYNESVSVSANDAHIIINISVFTSGSFLLFNTKSFIFAICFLLLIDYYAIW